MLQTACIFCFFTFAVLAWRQLLSAGDGSSQQGSAGNGVDGMGRSPSFNNGRRVPPSPALIVSDGMDLLFVCYFLF